MKEINEEWSVTYKQIGIVLISFVLGVIVALLLSNSQSSIASNFTTTELIGFVLSVILSGASIVLAIAAIALGKSSEQAVINRSDQSIRLQTEVFTKTTDALQAIKSSTDVTEKRIEDIISGRAGDLSKQIAEFASDETAAGNIDVKELEDKIKKSLTQSFEKKEPTESEREERVKRRNEAKSRRDQYEKHHDSLLYSLANKPDVKIEKLGHGTPSPDNNPKERYDAILDKNGVKTAISTFMPIDESRIMYRGYSDVVRSLAAPLQDENISKLYLIQFGDTETKADLKEIKESISLMKDDIASRIEVVQIPYSGVDDWVEGIEL
jgi:hypothetical protein